VLLFFDIYIFIFKEQEEIKNRKFIIFNFKEIQIEIK